MQYRPEIDGLRAVAVVPVILFHAGFNTFSGGFVGVDVFFVISGYLINSLILKDLESGTFTLSGFYERRARRILPALFLVMLCCIPFAWMWMPPLEFKGFGASVISVCLFASNILFWHQADYFDTASNLKPLLHTWSLAVEEQFYIAFPIVLLLLWRSGQRRTFQIIAALAFASLLASEYASRSYPSFNFFWAPTRAWELLSGSLCAFGSFKRHPARDNALSIAGISAILLSVFWFDSNTPMPSAVALCPVIGTCLVLLFGVKGTHLASLLSTRGFVGIGLVSYSAYLWHQPLFVFSRLRLVHQPSAEIILALCLVTFLLAYLSWRFVEIPWRSRRSSPLAGRRRILAFSLFSGSALVVFGLAANFTAGLPARWSAEALGLAARIRVNYGLHIDCDGALTPSINCRTGENPVVLLWGDSFAMHAADAVRAAINDTPFVQMTRSACVPILNFALRAVPASDANAEMPNNRAGPGNLYSTLSGVSV